jgi:uncharacterized phage protein (TIGR01671 family)
VEDFFVSKDGKIYKISKDTGYSFAISRETSDKVILMQSTGLKDKNGVEIFEGDIVSIDTDEFDLLFVKYEVGIYCLMDDEGCAEYLSDYYNYVSVVGNIYENKELLEEEE